MFFIQIVSRIKEDVEGKCIDVGEEDVFTAFGTFTEMRNLGLGQIYSG